MKRSLHIRKEPDFQKIIIASALLHLLFIALVTIPVRTKEREYKSYFVSLVAPAEIRGEAKAPAIKKNAAKKAVKVKPAPRRRVRPEKGVILEPPGKRVEKEIERLRAISALARRKKENEAEEEAVAGAIENIRKKKLGSVSSLPGVPGAHSSANSNSYRALISRIIHSHWGYPMELGNAKLEVIISFQLDEKGNVISYRVEKSSGSGPFDRSAIKAIRDSSPLPPHPVEREITVRFSP